MPEICSGSAENAPERTARKTANSARYFMNWKMGRGSKGFCLQRPQSSQTSSDRSSPGFQAAAGLELLGAASKPDVEGDQRECGDEKVIGEILALRSG